MGCVRTTVTDFAVEFRSAHSISEIHRASDNRRVIRRCRVPRHGTPRISPRWLPIRRAGQESFSTSADRPSATGANFAEEPSQKTEPFARQVAMSRRARAILFRHRHRRVQAPTSITARNFADRESGSRETCETRTPADVADIPRCTSIVFHEDAPRSASAEMRETEKS